MIATQGQLGFQSPARNTSVYPSQVNPVYRPQYNNVFQNYQPQQYQYPQPQYQYPQYAQPQQRISQGFARQQLQPQQYSYPQQQFYPQQVYPGYPQQQPPKAPLVQQAPQQLNQKNQPQVTKQNLPVRTVPETRPSNTNKIVNPTQAQQQSPPTKVPLQAGKAINSSTPYNQQVLPFQPFHSSIPSQVQPGVYQNQPQNFPYKFASQIQSQIQYQPQNFLQSPMKRSVVNQQQYRQLTSPQMRLQSSNQYLSPQRLNYGQPIYNGQGQPRLQTQSQSQKLYQQPILSSQQPMNGQIKSSPQKAPKSQEIIQPEEKVQSSPQKNQRPEVEPEVQNIKTERSDDEEEVELEELALQYEDGFIYRGQGIQPQTRQGFGLLSDQVGDQVYQGYWKDNNYHGEGLLNNFQKEDRQEDEPFDYTDLTAIGNYWTNYEGQFEFGKMHGKGRLLLSNGEYYTGEFKEGMVDGEGVFTNLDDQEIQGTWIQGNYVQQQDD